MPGQGTGDRPLPAQRRVGMDRAGDGWIQGWMPGPGAPCLHPVLQGPSSAELRQVCVLSVFPLVPSFPAVVFIVFSSLLFMSR